MRPDEVPILIYPRNDEDGKTALQLALEANNINSTNLLLSMIIKYQNNTCFNNLVDPLVLTLMEKGIDLKEYFESELPIHKIKDERFPNLHEDDSTQIIGINAAYPQNILSMYESHVGIHLESNEELNKSSIEYFFINLPECMQKEATKFINVLVESGTHDYFESLPIQTIINFKWEKYTRDFFIKQFRLFLVFFFANITDIYYSILSKEIDDTSSIVSDSRNLYVNIALKSTCVLILLYFAAYEIRQLRLKSIREHFSELWNWTDFLMIICYFIMAGLDNENFYIATTILQVIVVSLSFVKICFFLRIYEGFGFLVSLMSGVFNDIQYFFALWVLFICWFGIVFAILFKAALSPTYEALNQFGYFMLSYRLSLGDFELDNFTDQRDSLISFSWSLWMIGVFVMNVMFMNFIIAVISESYEKVMQRVVALSYKLKAEMIVERETLMTEQDKQNLDYFPKYLILRRAVGSDTDSSEEWQGFIKDIKSTMKITSLKNEKVILNQMQTLKAQIENVSSATKLQVQNQEKNVIEKVNLIKEEMRANLQKMEKKMENKMDQILFELSGKKASIDKRE